MKMIRKLMMMAVAAFAVAVGALAETEKVGVYTWTYRIDGDAAEIYGHSEMTYEEDIWSPPTYRFFPAVSPSPIGAVTIPSTLGGNGGSWSFSK